MHKAIRRGDENIARQIMRGGADRTMKNHCGYDAIKLALNHNRQTIFKLILGYNIEVEVQKELDAIFDSGDGWN